MEPKPPTRRKLEDQIQTLRDRGFTGEFVRQNGQVICRTCGTPTLAEDLTVVEEHQYPPDGGGREAILQAVTCPKCQVPGQVLTGHELAERP